MRDKYNFIENLNRIENNIADIKTRYQAIGFYPEVMPRAKAWSRSDFPCVSELNRIRQNIINEIETFDNAYNVLKPIVNHAKAQPFDYKKANELEIALDHLDRLEGTLKSNLLYCGTFNCGTNHTLQMFRRGRL